MSPPTRGPSYGFFVDRHTYVRYVSVVLPYRDGRTLDGDGRTRRITRNVPKTSLSSREKYYIVRPPFLIVTLANS